MHHWVASFFTAFFALIYVAMLRGWEKFFEKRKSVFTEKGLPADFSSFTMAAVHGVATCTLGVRLLSGWHFFDDGAFELANTPGENLALCLSLGYFLADTFMYLVPFAPENTVIYVIHHLGTALFLLASLHIQRGGTACVLGLFVGEATNPFFHAYNLLKGLRECHPAINTAYRYWAPVFTAAFLAVRTGLGPPMMFWWCGKVAVMDVPLPHRCLWIAASVGITLVSQAFAFEFAKESYDIIMSASKAKEESAAKVAVVDSAVDTRSMERKTL